MSKVIAIANQKGGVGKTSLTANLGVGLARKGKKVLLIDADSQGSLTKSLGYQTLEDLKSGTLTTILEKILKKEDFSLCKALLHHDEGVSLLPSDKTLSDLEEKLIPAIHREFKLKRYIDSVRDMYDYVLIDCMPSLGMVTVNALVAADSVIVPLQAHFLSMKGLEQLIYTILELRDEGMNPYLSIDGLLLTMVNNRTRYSKDIIDMIINHYGSSVNIFHTYIPESIRAAETSAAGVSIFVHDPHGKVAKAYESLTEEVLNYVG